jgi:hypothetical protein
MIRLAGTLLPVVLWAATVPSLAQEAPAQESAPSAYNQITGLATVSEFVVASGMLRSITGDKATCRSDQAFVLDALKTRKVTLAHCDYRVRVQQGRVAFPGRGDAKPLVVNVYQVKLQTCRSNGSARKYLEELAHVDYQSGRLPAQESPVTCYFFLADAALTLFGHYGFPYYYPGLEMGTVIREFKRTELPAP